MEEKILETELGNIFYWINDFNPDRITLIFLPGLTADHRLFEKQIEFFKDKYNVLVWDAPGHGKSWPFNLNFDLRDKAIWLNKIINKESIKSPIFIGQSMGGYVAQSFSELFPNKIKGFISIDSSSLQKSYYSRIELSLLKHMEPFYFYYPWKLLLKTGSNSVATTKYGKDLMLKMMHEYDRDKKRYSKLVGHGFRILAEAIEKDLDYSINCPTLLICGTKDKAGSAKYYNKKWHKKSGIPIRWIKGAGHNSNTDYPDMINQIINRFVEELK